ncbi:MAG TPA: IS481 family transposase, partial [Steroidobacteraceae bacterium]|jgi:putative transposase|nr:IS481 family transposase [Steroidobacteraceae bacterium]
MPWRECRKMDERLKFVARLLEGEKMAVLCREFDISRKTGYKIFSRYKDCGLEGLTDRSRRPYRHGMRLPFQIEKLIVQLKQDHPSWGAPKIREKIRRKHSEITLPAISTVHAVLDRNGLVTRRRKRLYKPEGTSLSVVQQPNELWCADYKGQFMLADKRYCYPLTVTDQASRYLLSCDALSSTQERYAFTVFERVFKDFGLPRAIRTDNGVPFASPNSMFGLSKLSVWWLRLGIDIERIKPGRPQQNGRHERMHLTLKKEATKPAAKNFLQQQGKFDRFLECFNQERPHQAIGMKYPAEIYTPSLRPYKGLSDLEYPFHDRTITVTCCGRICIGRRKINLSTVFAGQNVGIKEVSDKIWLVSFMKYDLGFFDHEAGRVECTENPFGAKLLPMSSE